MIYYALAVLTATSVTVADVYTTREPCERDARQFWQIMDVKPSAVRCIPTTEPDAESAEQQLTNIEIFLKSTK
jgi:hypothetical protein